MNSAKRIGLGLAALGRPGYINLGHGNDLRQHDVNAMQENAAAVLDAAWALGIVYYDAARSYGRAEEFLGHWLCSRNIPANKVTVASKWGYIYTADWRIDAAHHEVKEHTLPVLQRQTEESKRNLGSYLAVYQIHSATRESGVLANQGVLEELGRLRDTGWLIGLSVSGPRQGETVRQAMTVEVAGKALFGSVQATWNLLERSCEEALALAHRAGWRVVIKEGLANGRLTARNEDPAFAEQRRLLADVAKGKACSLDALSLAAILARDWVDVVLSGATTVAQLESNVRALDVSWDEETETRLRPLTETPHQYWQTRSSLAWN